MKVRKLAVALALAGSMGSNLAYALGLGEAEIKSSLNEPLRAEISLVSPGDLTRDEIIASLAPQRDFQRVGIEPIFFLNEIQFEVVKNDRGVMVLQLTTAKPVREPYLNFLVEVAWPSGRLLREYALLIDPPTFRDGAAEQPSQVAATRAAPAVQQPARPSQPAARSSQSGAREQGAARSTTPKATTYGPVSSTDTLWRIAMDVRHSDDLTPQQVMLALQDANPDAFLRNNINLVREGSVLRIPSEAEMRSRSPREAVQQVTAQNQSFAEDQRLVAIDASNRQPETNAATAPVVEQGDELRLLAGDVAAREDGSHAGNMGGSGAGDAESRLALSLEELDRSRRENDELSSRVEDLQEQLANMQRLIELKSDQLAALQAQSSNASGMDAAPETAESAGASDIAGTGDVSQGETGMGPTDGESAGTMPLAPADARTDENSQLAEADSTAAELTDTDETPVEDGMSQDETAQDTDIVSAGEAGTDQQIAQNDLASDATAEPATGPAPIAQRQAQNRAQEPEQAGGADNVSESAPTADFTPRGILEQVMTNPLYQVAAGALAVALLALLWLLARRNARREENFYAELQRQEADDPDGAAALFDTGLGAGIAGAGLSGDMDTDSEAHREHPIAPAEGHEDALAEADVYIAYGRLDQAAQVLERGISQEPSRSDLRLKLLEVYADAGDEEAFALQLNELESLDDEAALVHAESLRERLEAQSAAPSIDDLESELRGDAVRDVNTVADSGGRAEEDEDLGIDWNLDEPVKPEGGELASDSARNDAPTDSAAQTVAEDDSHESIDFDLDGFEFDEEAEPVTSGAGVGTGAGAKADAAEADDGLDFSLDEAELDAALTEQEDRGLDLSDEEIDALDLDADLDSSSSDRGGLIAAEEEAAAPGSDTELEEDLAELEEAQRDVAGLSSPSSGPVETAGAEASSTSAAFDDSFLEELDAELDRVGADDSDELESLAADDDELDNLELDVSDEDLALIEEVAGSEEQALDEADESELDGLLNDESANDGMADGGAAEADLAPAEKAAVTGNWLLAEDTEVSGEVPQLDPIDDEALAEDDFDDSLLNVNSDSMDDIEETDLDDEDDFDFLEGTDEAATKLDLARAYVEMGDSEGARDILEEVSLEGSDDQKEEAQGLLRKLA